MQPEVNRAILLGGVYTQLVGSVGAGVFARSPLPPTDAVAGAGGEWRQMDWFRFLMSSLIVYGALR
jgi:hypothetical protein